MNGEYRGEEEIGKLMHDFNCTNAKDMHFDLMADQTRYLKENTKGVSDMCKVIEDMRKEERAEGRVEGRAEGLLDNISALMKNLSVSAEKAMELLGVPAGEREGLLKKLPVT